MLYVYFSFLLSRYCVLTNSNLITHNYLHMCGWHTIICEELEGSKHYVFDEQPQKSLQKQNRDRLSGFPPYIMSTTWKIPMLFWNAALGMQLFKGTLYRRSCKPQNLCKNFSCPTHFQTLIRKEKIPNTQIKQTKQEECLLKDYRMLGFELEVTRLPQKQLRIWNP